MHWRQSIRNGVKLLLMLCLTPVLLYPADASAQCPGSFGMFIPQIMNNCSVVRFSWGYTTNGVTYQVEGYTGAGSYAPKGPSTTNLTVDVPISSLTPRGQYWTFRIKATKSGCPTVYSFEYFGFWVPPAPANPTGVGVQSLPGGQIKIVWNGSSVPSGQTAQIYKNGSAAAFATPAWSAGQYTYTEGNCGNFFFEVQARTSEGCASGKVLTPAVTRTPNAPALTAPADLATQEGGNVTFSWAAANCASTYTIQVDTENTFTAPFTINQSITGTSHLWTGPPVGTYYWRVMACNGGGCTNSATRTLTITAPSTPVTLTSPIGGENWAPGSQQVVTWSGGGTVRIDLFAEGTPSGGSLIGPKVTLNPAATGGSANVTLPADIATTRARVQITTTVGTTYVSYSPNTFRIVTPPAAGIWSYAAVDAPNNGWNQSDMCYNGMGGADAVYFDYLGGPDEDLRYASKPNKTSPWAPSIAHSAGKVGSWPSAVRGSDGKLHVAYYDHTIGFAKLYYTVRTGTTWSTPVLVAQIKVVQGDCSIALDPAGVPAIAFNTGNQDGNPNWMKLRVYKQQAGGTWAQFGATIDAVNPHHLTLKSWSNKYYLSFIDLSGTRMNIWIYNGVNWLPYTSEHITFATGPYTDASLALDPYGYPQLAYTAAGTGGGQKLVFHPWGFEGNGFDPPVTVDGSLGTIASVSIQYGWLYPRIGYVGNGVVKQVTGVYSETQWPVAWTPPEIVDATGNMDSQVSLVVNPGNDERWFMYRDLGTNSMRSAWPYYVDPPPAPVTDLGFTAGYTTGVAWWTAPDDGNGNAAVAYDLRYSISAINEGNFYNGTPWPTNAPQPPGSPECLDMTLQSCSTYYWAIKSRDEWGTWSAVSNSPGDATSCSSGQQVLCALAPQGPPSDIAALPATLSIGAISPNPASSPVVIPLAIPAALSGADVEMKIFDVTGRLVRTIDGGIAEPGIRQIDWDLRESSGGNAANGVYFVRVRVGNTIENRRVLLAR